MAHLDYDAEAGTRSREWLAVGAQIGELVNTIAGRYDLVGLAGPVAGSGAPACFKPQIAEVEVNTTVAFGAGVTPMMVGNLNQREVQYEWPKATGAILHEAFHARFSKWDLANAQAAFERSDEFEALVLLEESRIETQGLWLNEKNRVFLRASALEIALGDFKEAGETTTVEQLASLVGLIHARVLGGVLEFDEVADVITSVNSALGEDTVRKLSSILRKVQAHTDHSDASELYPLAREWAQIVRDLKKERGEDTGNTSGASAKMMKDILEKLSDAAEEVSIKNFTEISDQQTAEEWEEEVKNRAKDSKEQQENEEVANEVFGKGTGPMPESPTRSRLIESRKPKSEERSAAVVVARMLEKAKYRERDAVEIASILPPGRLRTKALVQQAAQRERGINKPVEAFRRTVRKQTEDPTLTVGVLVDISGSMNSAMEPMAVTAWVMSEAVKRVQGRTAMVYFGQDVFPTLKPGQHLDDVSIYSAMDGTEVFDKAFKALDGSLNLLHGNGARLLVVVSDGCFTGKEVQATRKWIARCEQSGVAVLWIPFDDGGNATALLRESKVTPLVGTLDPAKAASEIGSAAAKALTQVGARNA